jgi:hypothetical protein
MESGYNGIKQSGAAHEQPEYEVLQNLQQTNLAPITLHIPCPALSHVHHHLRTVAFGMADRRNQQQHTDNLHRMRQIQWRSRLRHKR